MHLIRIKHILIIQSVLYLVQTCFNSRNVIAVNISNTTRSIHLGYHAVGASELIKPDKKNKQCKTYIYAAQLFSISRILLTVSSAVFLQSMYSPKPSTSSVLLTSPLITVSGGFSAAPSASVGKRSANSGIAFRK